MKKVICTILCLIMLFGNNITASSKLDIPITILINDQFMYSNTPSYTEGGYHFIAIRPIFEVLGAKEIKYRSEDNSVTVVDDLYTIQFFVDQQTVMIDGYAYSVDFTTQFVNGKIMIPFEFVADLYGLEVEIDEQVAFWHVTSPYLSGKTNATEEQIYTEEDVLWLARIVHVEVGYLPQDVKLAVANVVLNRVKSPSFPDSIKEVIYQKGQFPPAYKDGFSDLVPTEDDLYVAKLALSGQNNISSCLFFNHRPFKSKEDDFYMYMNGEYFYY